MYRRVLPLLLSCALVASAASPALALDRIAGGFAARAAVSPVVASRLVLPSKRLTPGAAYASATLGKVCHASYVASIPSVSLALQKHVFDRYHIAGSAQSQYEIDRLISSGIGGSNALTNLWPLPLKGRYGAKAKAEVDRQLRAWLCSGGPTIAAVQHFEAANWYTAIYVMGNFAQTYFPDGAWTVESDVMPAGTYTSSGGPHCNWQRERDSNFNQASIIAFGLPDAHAIVTIEPTDVAFWTHGCGWWTRYEPSGSLQTVFGPGTWAIGGDITAGTYEAPGGTDCYWEREQNFSGAFAGVIENSYGALSPVVAIRTGDAGFRSTSCGTWSLVTSG
jgi:hypothetical protein